MDGCTPGCCWGVAGYGGADEGVIDEVTVDEVTTGSGTFACRRGVGGKGGNEAGGVRKLLRSGRLRGAGAGGGGGRGESGGGPGG